MGARILYDRTEGYACWYDSTSGMAFGPVFSGDLDRGLNPADEAAAFGAWLASEGYGDDPRSVDVALQWELMGRFSERATESAF